ncbi:uncharacterized protein LOC128724737 [Anopheles nili]|uniref:uncharacterized protein LOC128724737 n=1 Tax=Anopheles nili TaxID=185578 RepID=UPI00237C18B2|nr:uncharacterized protein LOC128724737 [Anopheles nili]
MASGSHEANQDKELRATREPAVKKAKKSQPLTEERTNEPVNPNQPVLAFEKLHKILGRHYFDVCDRLALDYVPSCVRNVTECAQHHANKRSARTKCVSLMRQNNTQEQILEQRPDQYVEFVNQALMRREFIDSELFVAGLQLILTINQPTDELKAYYDVATIVLGTSEALEKCLDLFPPCRWDLRATYQSIVFAPLDASCFAKCDQKEGLCRNVLHLIEHYMETEQPSNPAKAPTGSTRSGRNLPAPSGSELFFSNYNCWMSQNRQCYDFDQLSRDERFQRLFAVLQILVKLLEMDFAMWILRNPTKTRQNLCNPSRCPLIARLVWEGDYGSVNLFVRKLFQMFINMNALQYPAEDIAIFARLLNLVTVAVNLSEFQHNDGLIQYPCVKDNSEYFARQLLKTLESSDYYSVALYLRTIHNLRSPFLRLRLSEQLIRKLNGLSRLSNVREFFQQLLKRAWLECDEELPPDTAGRPAITYAVLSKQRTRTKASEIYRQQYVDLLYIGCRAYCDMYQIPAYFREIIAQTLPQTPPAPERTRTRTGGQAERDLGVRIVPEPVTDERMIFQGVAVTSELLLEYREDIKYLLLIEQELKRLELPEETVLFRKWIKFMSDVDPSLVINVTS